MRAPFQKAPAPRIRALTGAPSRPKAPSVSQGVFRDFVATLERLEKGRRKKKSPEKPSAPGGREA